MDNIAENRSLCLTPLISEMSREVTFRNNEILVQQFNSLTTI